MSPTCASDCPFSSEQSRRNRTDPTNARPSSAADGASSSSRIRSAPPQGGWIRAELGQSPNQQAAAENPPVASLFGECRPIGLRHPSRLSQCRPLRLASQFGPPGHLEVILAHQVCRASISIWSKSTAAPFPQWENHRCEIRGRSRSLPQRTSCRSYSFWDET
jgi:hypothetical protein